MSKLNSCAWTYTLDIFIKMGMNLSWEVRASSYTQHHKCCMFPFPSPGLDPLLISWSTIISSSAVQAVSSRSMDFPVLPPWLIAYADKEVGQANWCSFQGLLKQLKRRRRGVCSDWWVGHWLERWAYELTQTPGLSFLPVSIYKPIRTMTAEV